MEHSCWACMAWYFLTLLLWYRVETHPWEWCEGWIWRTHVNLAVNVRIISMLPVQLRHESQGLWPGLGPARFLLHGPLLGLGGKAPWGVVCCVYWGYQYMQYSSNVSSLLQMIATRKGSKRLRQFLSLYSFWILCRKLAALVHTW